MHDKHSALPVTVTITNDAGEGLDWPSFIILPCVMVHFRSSDFIEIIDMANVYEMQMQG
jgi:hypothetical protein